MSDEKSGVQPSVNTSVDTGQPAANQEVEKKTSNSAVSEAVAEYLGTAKVATWVPANPLGRRSSGVKYGQDRQRNATVTRQV